ncbi:MAG: hypothetical protein H6742_03410 [Alphaproteobacteria bacterium]|nr:hypothetical protein [Alphaproteobacteria bacterium]
MLLPLLLALTAPAHAGSGPWVLGRGDHTLYLGVEGQRFDHLAQSTGSGSDDVLDVGQGVQTFGVKAIGTIGVLDRMEVELAVPWQSVRQNHTESFPCQDLTLDACKATKGLGIVRGRAKVVALDELFGPPVTLSFGGELRLGQATAPDRERITNRGEGSMDAGAFVVVGRSGGLGQQGYWSAYLEGGGRYRSASGTVVGVEAPGPEVWSEAQLLLSPGRLLAVGPEIGWLWRPTGHDVEDMLTNLDIVLDVDRFGSLNIMSLQAGGKAIVRASDATTVSFGLSHTAYAINNPTDVWAADLGVSFRGFLNRHDG